jgi:hypothetical protein
MSYSGARFEADKRGITFRYSPPPIPRTFVVK